MQRKNIKIYRHEFVCMTNWYAGFSMYKFKFLGIVLTTLCLAACEPWELEESSFEEVATEGFDFQILPTEVILSGTISGLLETDLIEIHGHVWALSDNPEPDINNKLGQTTLGKIGNSSFESSITNLAPGTAYNYRAYVVFPGNQAKYGEVKSFVTKEIEPQLEILSIEQESALSFSIDIVGTFSNLPIGLRLNSYGLVWSNEPNAAFESAQIISETAIEIIEPSFSYNRSFNLAPGQSFIRPFIAVNGKIYYGAEKMFGFGDIWQQKDDLPNEEINGSAFFAIDEIGYLVESIGNLFIYNPFTATWQQKNKPLDNLADTSAKSGFSIGNSGYVLNREGQLFSYNPQTDVWIQKMAFPGTPSTQSFALADKGYVLESDGNNFYEYNPITDQWIKKQDFPGERRFEPAGFTIGDKGYIGLGRIGFDEVVDFWEYDVVVDQWTRKADFAGRSRRNQVSFTIDGKGYVGIGYYQTTKPNPLSDFWSYDPVNDKWEQKADFPDGGRAWAFGFSLNGKGYIGAGRDQFFTNYYDFWEYTPD